MSKLALHNIPFQPGEELRLRPDIREYFAAATRASYAGRRKQVAEELKSVRYGFEEQFSTCQADTLYHFLAAGHDRCAVFFDEGGLLIGARDALQLNQFGLRA